MGNLMIYPDIQGNKKGGAINKDGVCTGIDLGTTYSLMGTVDPQYVDLKESTRIPVQFVSIAQYSPFPFDQVIEDEKVASIVAIHDGKPFVGNNLYHLKGHPDFKFKTNLFYNWKVEMGVDHHPMYPDAINERLDMPFKIAGGILNYMRKSFVGNNKLGNAIITVPASFQANQRKDTLRAAEMANIETKENMLIDEPNAAFLGYFNRLANEEKQRWAKEVRNKNVLVVDFGGGTLDLSILNVDFRRETGIAISNRAISRYNDLGGQDIDLLVAEEFLIPELKKVCTEFDSLDFSDLADYILPQLSVIGEALKIGICEKLNIKAADKDVKELDLNEIKFTRRDCKVSLKGVDYVLGDVTINGTEFQSLFIKFFRGKQYKFKYVDKAITTISSSINEIIEKAELSLDEINFILFVGGSSFNPFLSSLSKEKLVNSEPLYSHEPDKLVAEGAAVYSYFLNVHNVSLISPITSDTLGIRLKGDQFHPIIEKGHSLPEEVDIPSFKLPSNMLSEVVVPICINSAEYTIGEIRCTLNSFYDLNTVVRVQAKITIDKVFTVKVFANDDLIGDAEFENPFSNGLITKEKQQIIEIQSKLNKAKRNKNKREEKQFLRELIWEHNKVNNHIGTLDCAEEYIKKFDDLDQTIWNMIYIGNSNLGRVGAAKKALDRAIELDPDEPIFRYNYSLMLEKEDPQLALNYLEGLPESIKEAQNVRSKVVLLKNELGLNCEEEARKIAMDYNKNPELFSHFCKANLLKSVFDIADEPYVFIEKNQQKKMEDENKYLITQNLPF